jgi:hypothetical protein
MHGFILTSLEHCFGNSVILTIVGLSMNLEQKEEKKHKITSHMPDHTPSRAPNREGGGLRFRANGSASGCPANGGVTGLGRNSSAEKGAGTCFLFLAEESYGVVRAIFS